MKRLVTIILLTIIQVVAYAQRGKVRPEWDINGGGSHHSIDDDLYSFLFIVGLVALFFIFLAIRGALSSSRGNTDYRRTESDHNSGNSEYSGEYKKMGYSSGVPVDNEEKPSKEGSHSKWTPIGDAFTLKEICDETGMFDYDDILGDEAELIGIEFADGSSTLRIAIPLKDGAKKELKAGIGIQNKYEEGDKVKVNLIYGQELHKIGQPNIVRYDVWESKEQKEDYLRKRDGEDPSTEVSEEQNLSTEVTEEDLANAWTDDFGIQYSSDKSRLIGMANGRRIVITRSGITSVRFIPKCDLIENLKNYFVMEGTEYICNKAFGNCIYLETISIPSSLVDIGRDIFDGCISLALIQVPVGLKQKYVQLIPEYKSIIVEQNVDNHLNTDVTKVDLLSAWVDEYGVMYSKDKKRLLKSPEFKKKYSYTDERISSMYNLEMLETIDKVIKDPIQRAYVYSDNVKKYQDYKLPPKITEYAINEGTLVVCDYAFENCDGLIKISLPLSLEKVGCLAFEGCANLDSLIIPKGSRKKFEQLLPEYKDKLVEHTSYDSVKIN